MPYVPVQLSAFEYDVLDHVVNRYKLYILDSDHLRLFSAPLLTDVLNSLNAGGNLSDKMPGGPRVTVLSCHDTTLLGLLYTFQLLDSSTGPDTFTSSGTEKPAAMSWPGFGELTCLY